MFCSAFFRQVGAEEGLQTQDERRNVVHVAKLKRDDMSASIGLYTSLCTDGKLDDRARLHFKDMLLSTAATTSVLAGPSSALPAIMPPPAAAGVVDDVLSNKVFTLAEYLKERGLQLDPDEAGVVGKRVAALMPKTHRRAPFRVFEKMADGVTREVNAYFKDVLDEAVMPYITVSDYLHSGSSSAAVGPPPGASYAGDD